MMIMKYNSWKLNRTGHLPVNLLFAADEQPLWIGLNRHCNYSGSSLTVCELALNTFGSSKSSGTQFGNGGMGQKIFRESFQKSLETLCEPFTSENS